MWKRVSPRRDRKTVRPMETNVWELLLAVGLPTAIVSGVVGMLFWRLKQWETQRKEEQEKRDVARRELELLQIKGTLAAMALGEATATALKNGHCNGETERALDYEQRVKHEIRDFLAQSGVDHTA